MDGSSWAGDKYFVERKQQISRVLLQKHRDLCWDQIQIFLASLLQREAVATQAKKPRWGMRPKLYLISLGDTNRSHPNPLSLQGQNYVHLSKGVLMFRNRATQTKMSKDRDAFPHFQFTLLRHQFFGWETSFFYPPCPT